MKRESTRRIRKEIDFEEQIVQFTHKEQTIDLNVFIQVIDVSY